jgi:hypothetical protein
MTRAKRPVRLPVVLTEDEVAALLSQLRGTKWLMASRWGMSRNLLNG